MIEYLRHLHETTDQTDEPSLVARLDQQPAPSPRKRRGTAELSVGIVLWPRFPLLSLSGLTDALRHAADTGDQSLTDPLRMEGARHTGATRRLQWRAGRAHRQRDG